MLKNRLIYLKDLFLSKSKSLNLNNRSSLYRFSLKFAVILILFFPQIQVFGQDSTPANVKEHSVCGDDSDITRFSRRRVLNLLADVLLHFNSITEPVRLSEGDPDLTLEIYTKGRPFGFTVYDLNDPTNFTDPGEGCINFIENHIYHFSPIQLYTSHSFFVIPQGRNLLIFRRVNCQDTKDNTIEDVVKFAETLLKDNKSKDEIIDRIKNYRKFGLYLTIDTLEISCNTNIKPFPARRFNIPKYTAVKGKPFIIEVSKPLPRKPI